VTEDGRRPETRYARLPEGAYVAYQVFGAGRLTLVFITSWQQNLDVMWDEPSLASYLERLGSFARVICFDKRGTGVSDPVPLASLPTIEQWMDDARIVMDAVGVEEVALLGDTEGGPMAALLAATHPERVTALVLVNSFARWRRADDYPIGMPEATWVKLLERYEQNSGVTAEFLDLTAPSVANDPRFRAWFTRYQRLSMPRGASSVMYRWVTQMDVRAALPTIRVPTLVLQRSAARHHRAAFGRYLAERIPGARYVELPGADTLPFHAGDFTPLVDEVEEFLTGTRAPAVRDGRQLATILFTDIVGSTRLAAERGDAAWAELIRRHDEVVRTHLERYRGRELRQTGDGFVALFDGPARAVTCAARATEALRELGIPIRAGLHSGEVELANGDVGGLAVHIAARVMDAAGDGAILVSGTVRDLVVGSGIEFAERGEHELRGVPGRWKLYAVAAVP
jgi:class 3 adenylate cyclase/pimeloyl-ACP methyl ester carboxylesterase